MKSIKLIKAVVLIYIVGVGVEAIGDTVIVDGLTFSPVPLPSAVWLFSIGLGALWITARRHRPGS